MGNVVVHGAQSRGFANHGWLKSHHTFSFAGYYDPQRVHFGALRVLNDDEVAGGQGFGTHPHDNMEIISIPLEGALEHRDSMGTVSVIRKGDVQIMSAGTGVSHSEYNKNADKPVKFLQIWIFPNKKEVTPRYGQISLNENDRLNKFDLVISPQNQGGKTWMHQDAWFYISRFENKFSAPYQLKKTGHGVYIFVLQGELQVNEHRLNTRDGLGAWGLDNLMISTPSSGEFILMEVPMHV